MRSLSSALLVVLLALTNVGSALHYALVKHAIADDGGLIHVDERADTSHAAPNSVSEDETVTQLPSTGCAVSAFQRQAYESPAPAQAVTIFGTAYDPLPIFCLRVADSGDIYRLAPKSGPPA